MTRISTFCVLSSTLAVITLSANGARAATITVPVPRVIVHVPQPKVTVQTPQPKVTVQTPQLKILGTHSTVVGTNSNHVLLKGGTGEIANKKIDSSAIQSVGFPSLDATDKAASKISTVNPVAPFNFNFNKIKPAGRASVVFVPGARLAAPVPPFISYSDSSPPPTIYNVIATTSPPVGLNTMDPAGSASVLVVPGADAPPPNYAGPSSYDGQAGTVNDATNQIKNQLDSLNDVSDMASMRLQMTLQGQTKLLNTMSDIEKSMSDTDMAIVGNIKQ